MHRKTSLRFSRLTSQQSANDELEEGLHGEGTDTGESMGRQPDDAVEQQTAWAVIAQGHQVESDTTTFEPLKHLAIVLEVASVV